METGSLRRAERLGEEEEEEEEALLELRRGGRGGIPAVISRSGETG